MMSVANGSQRNRIFYRAPGVGRKGIARFEATGHRSDIGGQAPGPDALDKNGNVFGATLYDAAAQNGGVFEITP